MKNNDLISRSALMRYINENHSYAGLPMAAHILTMELLTYAPAVEAVEVVHGQWIHHYFDSGELIDDNWYCSECHMCNGRRRTWYCPNCGAKMDGDIK